MTEVHKWEGGWLAGGDDGRADGQIRIKYVLVVGGVRPYGGAYQGGTRGQTRDRENVRVWRIQYQNGQNGGLELAVRGLDQGQVDCGVL